MKLEELFEFDKQAYALGAAQADTQHLRQSEIVKTRQILKSQASTVSDTITAVVTGGATILQPIYSGRAGDVATEKLKIIQAELTKRGIPLHVPDEKDSNAATLGFVAGELAGDAIDGAIPTDLPPAALDLVLADMAAGEAADGAVSEYIDKLPTSQCSRPTLKKHHRLNCNACGVFFDSSFTDYYRKYFSSHHPLCH